jgi:amino acid adenylation domain-containing protein/non-ribosomal peptide synthase protein (TIGR01720 family)
MNSAIMPESATDIAIIGMSGRFPGANNLDMFWQNISDAVESITFFRDDELESSPMPPTERDSASFVKAGAILDDIELFDATFFGYSPGEAKITDPQQRLFLECAWEALEQAGYDAEQYKDRIGVFSGVSPSSYLRNNLHQNDEIRALRAEAGTAQLTIGNTTDSLSACVAYKLNLKRPSSTACSTALEAVHLACQGLLDHQCDMALAGGASISVPQRAGYWYRAGGVVSPDGHCRTFDANAQGSVFGNGVGVVVLKRLADALAHGDPIHAVIKGSAVNNAGASQLGFTAPDIDRQAALIAQAHAAAGVAPTSISYIEAHGAATPLDDQIEIAALTQVFRAQQKRFCAIGSVKTNIGHTNIAAGMAGLIKTILALKHRQIPPSLHFEHPNPQIDFANSPFYVNTTLTEWQVSATPRRAGVSSFGVGGTNAHVVLEEAPRLEAPGPARSCQLLVLSARTASALEAATDQLVAYFKQHPHHNLADVAYTMQVGRRAFSHRRMLVCESQGDARRSFEARDPKRVLTSFREQHDRPVAFMFSGQGAQYVGMAADLYQFEPVFRKYLDRCAELLVPHLGRDLRELLYPHDDGRRTTNDARRIGTFVVHHSSKAAGTPLDQTQYAQPALFVIAYALAQLWLSWGVQPDALIGHGIGEYVAACLAGVLALEDALALVALRGRLMQSLPGGAMLEVRLAEQELQPLLSAHLALAAVDGPARCVVSGPHQAVDELQRRLTAQGLDCHRLHTSHAFHSEMMDAILEPFTRYVRTLSLNAPGIPYISNVTGTWITAAEVTTPSYWSQQLRQTVRFGQGLCELLREPDQILLEIGPGQTLSALVRQHPDKGAAQTVLASLHHAYDQQSDVAFALNTLGQLWLAGARVDWAGLYTHERRRRVPLPTYPFERQRCWVEATQGETPSSTQSRLLQTLEQTPQPQPTAPQPQMQPADVACADRAPSQDTPPNHDQTDSDRDTQNNVEDIYRLSPVQKGMLFHWLDAPASDMYFEQFSWIVDEDLDMLTCARAWRYVVQRHTILRTTFFWENLAEPLQVVHRQMDMPLVQHDWRALSPDEQSARLETLLAEDRRQGFDLTQIPLMRLALIQIAATSYRIVWSYPHLLLDGRSGVLVVEEFAACYAAFRRGEAPRLGRPRPYRDYITWLRKQDLAAAELFWRQTLAGVAVPTPLPADRAPGHLPTRDTAYAQQQIGLPPTATDAVQALARRQHLTLNMLFQGAWALLLSRYSGADDVVFGATVSGRSRGLAVSESMIGLFINTLPVRVRVPPAARLMDWLSMFQMQQVELRQYEHSPLTEIQRWSGVSHELPLFESIIVFENISASPRGHRLDKRVFQRTNYPLTLVIEPGPSLGVRIGYECRRFDAAAISRLLGQLQVVLEGMIAQPACCLADVPLLTAAERQQLLVEWNDTAAEIRRQAAGDSGEQPDAWALASDACVHQLFEAQALHTPDAVAAGFDGPGGGPESLTYRELNRRANRLARLLVAQRVGPEVVVAVLAARDPAFLTAMLAIFKAGGAYLPLDPRHPPQRLRQVLQQSGTSLVLAAEEFRSVLAQAFESMPSGKRPVVRRLDDLLQRDQAGDNLPLRSTARQLAYVIYTSGSTGLPKGAMIEQRGMINHLCSKIAELGLVSLDSVAQNASQGFDISVWQFLATLLVGGRVHIFADEVAFHPAHLIERVARARVSILEIVPSLLRAMLSEMDRQDGARPDLTALRWLIPTGEALPPELCRQWFDVYPDIPLLNAYGPTECADDVTHAPIRQPPADDIVRMPIGRPIANMRLYLMDARLRPVPIGVIGDLYVGGSGVGRGYLNDAGRTAQVFVPHPFADDTATRQSAMGTRLYKTGDRARWLADGRLEFLGRQDDQVKVRGYRIELDEIEALLRQHPAIREAAVLVREDTPDDRRLVAYVVPTEDERRTPNADHKGTLDRAPTTVALRPASLVSELRAFLAERLPDYMLPAAFVLLEALPLTPNGKLDRRALPAADRSRPALGQALVAPHSLLEDLLATIWAQVLDIGRVGIHDNFFALGGHSLLVTQVIAQVRATFNTELPLRSLFDAPTIAQLAERIATAQREAQGLLPPPLRPLPRGDGLRLSFAQERLWFLDQLQPHSPLYTIASTVYMRGSLDLMALQQSLNSIIQRHEALRTTFVALDGLPNQLIGPARAVRLPVLDLQALPPQQPEAQARLLTRAEAQRPFDLARGPLVRTVLFRLGTQDHVVVLTMHHIIADGWSMGILIEELTALYAACTSGQPAGLPALPIQYADYATWQRTWLQGAVLEAQLAYWRQQLLDLPALELPMDHPRPAIPSVRGAYQTFELPPRLSTSVMALRRAEGATAFMVLLAAFQVLLARYSGQADIVVGTPIANRTWAEVEPLIGFFVNTLVLRTTISAGSTFLELLRQVRECALAAYAHQDLPFEQLVEALQPQRDLSRNPLFQVMFALQNAPMSVPELAGLSLRPLSVSTGIAKFDLTLNLEERSEGLAGWFEYKIDLFEATTIARMARHFQVLLEASVAEPTRLIALLPFVTEAERQQILVEWNATELSRPHERCIHEFFEAQARRTCDAIAVIQGQQHLTYQELNQRSNRLAHFLQRLGVGPEVRVGVCMGRSLELVVGLLGILKAGGAYVPLDPTYPAERLAFMLEDAAVSVLVTMEDDAGARSIVPQTTTDGSPETKMLAHGDSELGQRLGSASPDLHGSRSVVDLRADWPAIGRYSAARPTRPIQPNQIAYLIYTSGSTGTPKAVMVEHRQLLNTLWSNQSRFAFQPGDSMLALASFAFDIALFELFAPLLAGGRIWLLTQEQILDLPHLAATLQQATALHAVPSLLRQLLQTLAERSAPPGSYDHIRLVCVGGERVPAELLREIQQHFRRAVVQVLYGPTEATIICASYVVPERYAGTRAVIGRALGNVQLYLLDPRGQPLPVGVAGEISIGGASIARGYHDRPDLTAARFVPNPFLATNDERPPTNDERAPDDQPGVLRPASCVRLYRTGDLARYLPDGRIEFLGRIDQQVKLRGYRIEPGEIEAVLNRHPAVQQSLVLAREDGPSAVRLVAYVVTTNDDRRGTIYRAPIADEADSSFVGDLRAFLCERLPDYMVPAAFVLIEALPLLPNGKIDRRALPAPTTMRPAKSPFVAPRTPVEELLAVIWSSLLRLTPISLHDNFFALGGHSLLGTQVIARIRAAFAIELPLRSLFEAPTIAGLAERITMAQREAQELLVPPLGPAPRDGPLPLSFAQQRLWFLDQLQPHSAVYNLPTPMRLSGPLDVAALKLSFNTMRERHEILRTSFALVDGQPYQQIHRPQPAPLPLLDLHSLPMRERAFAVRSLALEESQLPFDLARGPLVRMTALRLSADAHVLLVTMHHIIADAWSMSVFVDELVTLYAAYTVGQAAALPELPIQYADYAVWQRQWLQGALLTRQLAYWRQQLAELPLMQLPTDRPRSAVSTFQGAAQTFTLSAPLTESLLALSAHAGATLFMTLQAAFLILLARYSGQDDIVVGTTIANRTHSETEGLIGCFFNTLVLRTRLAGRPTVREVLGRVREVCLSAYAHQDLPFERLVEALQPVRDLSREPLVQVLFELQNTPIATAAVPGLTLHPLMLEQTTAKFDLNLSFTRTEAGLVGALIYATDLFTQPTIQRLLGHMQTLLEGIAADPDRRFADLPLLTDAEWHELIIARNSTQADYPAELCFHQLFEAQVARSPEAIALVFEPAINGAAPAPSIQRGSTQAQHLSYCELDLRANQLAQYLQSCGVGPEVRVGICLERSVELLIGLLGIFKAGGAFVPIEPAFPPERQSLILADAQVALVLTQARLRARLPAAELPVICLDADWAALAGSRPARSRCTVTAANLAYLIYTSGSTGRPKGVPIPHRSLVNYLVWCAAAYAVAQGRGAPVQSSIAADAIFPSLFAPLLAGTSVILIPESHALEALAASLRTAGTFSMVKITPSQLEVLNQQIRQQAGRAGGVRTLVVGAEALRGELLASWQSAAPRTILLNEYGPTETVVGCSIYQVETAIAGAVPIGLPIANTQFYVLDAQMQPVPIGVPGELYIGGDGVAWGYHNRPTLTAERFVPDPFGATPGKRLYKTGDSVQYLSDRAGNIVFMGRLDDQVKIRGYRVEPGEVEVLLGRHPQVRDVAVLAHEDRPGSVRLVAYVVSTEAAGRRKQDASAPSSAVLHPASFIPELRAYLKERVPEYMIPAAVVLVAALPLTPHGKLDRRALPAPDSRLDLSASFVAPRIPSEELLAQIWADVLGLAQVGVHDNFFEFGGHSLLAIRIIARVREIFQVNLPLRCLFEAPTVAGLAQQIQRMQREMPEFHAPPLRPVPRDGAVPVSFAQQRLWFLDQFEPSNAAYNLLSAMRLCGALDIAALERSLNMIVERHEVLRTTFTTEAGRPVQLIAPALAVGLPLLDLQALPSGKPEAAMRRLVQQEARWTFDLQRGPLLRITLLRLAPQEHVLLLNMHHIISDGWSTGVFVGEFAERYLSHTTGRPARLSELPIQYADYAIWQRGWLQGAVLAEQLAYWRRQLADLPTLDLPLDHPRPPVQTFQGTTYRFMLPPAFNAQLAALSQREQVTPFMTLLATFQVLLARYSRQDDIVVGTPVANRMWGETEGLLGFFVNTLVLRTDLVGARSFRALLGRVREVCLSAYAHQDLPFEQVVDALQPERSLSRHPLFQVMFILQNAPLEPLQLPGLIVRPIDVESTLTKFDLTLSMIESADGLIGMLDYRTDLFDAPMIGRMAGHIQTLLAAIVADPTQPIRALPLLTASERQQLIEWNATQTAYPQERCLHQLFEAQVKRVPDAIALVFDDQHLTYRELNTWANRLGQRLQRLGAGPEIRIGLCLERSLELVVGLLGILKAGGTYVPLDPSYPPERLAYMLRDSQAHVLVTMDAGRWAAGDGSLEQATERPPDTQLSDRHVSVAPWLGSVLDLRADRPAISQQPNDNPASAVTPANPAYVIYTSGSTGTPKGAVNSHRAIVNRLLWMHNAYPMARDDRVLQKTPISFDVSVWEFFWPLSLGTPLVLAQPGGHQDSVYLVELIVAQQITIAHFVPSMLDLFLQEPTLAACRCLKRVICSGETLSFGLQERFAARLNATLHNLYGPTEAAIEVTAWTCAPANDRPVVPIGRPIANTQIWLLDHDMQPVPIGVAGELHIGGGGLARGYLGRPALTAERFVPNPFATTNDERRTMNDEDSDRFVLRPASFVRLYKTGDLARYRPDGAIEYLGRIDRQVKLRGQRIELREIEMVQARHAGVRDCVVLAREDEPNVTRLVAYVVARQQPAPTVNDLRSFLQKYLPGPMLPSAFVFLEALPLMPNGKVDHRALPAPDTARPALASAFAAPQTANEQALADIWAQVLRVERVGVHDNFFAIGGDSILSLQIIARAKAAGLYLTPKQLFQYQTIAEIAGVAGSAPTTVAEQGLVVGPSPLTPIQCWFFEQRLPEPHHWNQVLLLEPKRRLAYAAVAQVVRHLLIHHDALRLRFVSDGTGWQAINAAPEAALPLTWLDFAGLPEAQRRGAIERTAAAFQASLNLTAGPILQVVYFDLGSKRAGRLLIIIHHLAIDGVSWRILLEDFQTAYQQLERGQVLALPAKTTSFQQWAKRLAAHAQSAALQPEASYWLAESRDRRARLPLDYPAGVDGNTRASVHTVSTRFSVEETRALLQEVPAAYHTQIADVLLTALVQAFSHWASAGPLLIDLEGHGREPIFDDIDLSRTVGWLTTIFPVLLELGEDADPGEALKQVKEQLRAVPNRGIGYGLLRYLGSDPARRADLQALPQAEISFNYLGQVDQALADSALFRPASEACGPAHSPLGRRRHVLEINGFIAGGQLQFDWAYSEKLHQRATVERLAHAFGIALRSLIEHCLAPETGGYTPSDFPKMRFSQEELDDLIVSLTQENQE